jgi:hypothetical protein
MLLETKHDVNGASWYFCFCHDTDAKSSPFRYLSCWTVLLNADHEKADASWNVDKLAKVLIKTFLCLQIQYFNKMFSEKHSCKNCYYTVQVYHDNDINFLERPRNKGFIQLEALRIFQTS